MITTDEDPTNPRSQFFLNYDESPAQKLVASWSLGFVDESISEPKETEKIRFSESNNIRVYVLEQKLRNLRQENNRVSLYFAQLKTLWDEISSCESVCVCITTNCPVLVEMRKREERKRIMVFLMGLNDGLAQARNQVLLRDPLPSLDEVVNLITQQESNQEHAGKLPQAVAMRNGDQIVLQQENTSIAEQSTVETTTTPLVPRLPIGPEVVEQQLSLTTSPSKSFTFDSKHISAHISSDSLPECTTNREKENQEDSKTLNQPRLISKEDNSVRLCAAANFESPRAPFSIESTFKEKPDQMKNTNQGIAVDMSLSTSMGSPEIISSKKSPPENYGFQHLIDAGLPVCSGGAFRDNIRQFVLKCAMLEDYDLEGMSVWRTSLVYEKRAAVLPLYTVEECVKCSDSPFCDYCRSAGWEHHLMSKKRYHLIIPGNDEWNNRLGKGAFDLQTHLLHGLIHSNGYGHLICINGIEGGSEFIFGREIMDLWDRICTSLHVRQISVIDISRKHNIELRLLNGVSYDEQSWFGRWGYRYVRGRYGAKRDVYQMSMDRIRSIEVGRVIDVFDSTDEGMVIEEIISYYEGKNGKKFVTIGDVFRFMQALPRWKNRSVIKSKEKSVPLPYLARNSGSEWPVKRLESAVEVIVDVLQKKGRGRMSRHEVRDAALPRIGEKMLVEYVLTLMDNVIVGNYMVRRAVNRYSKKVEYSIQDIKGKDSEAGIATTSEGRMVDDDIVNLYRIVLCYGPTPNHVFPTVNVVLLCKNFIKEFPLRDEDGDSLSYICRLTIEHDLEGIQPGVSVTIPANATVGDLKMAVQNAMRETYCVTEELTVSEILGLEEGVRDEDGVKGLVESGEEIWVRCCGLDLERFEGQEGTRVIDCECGAQDEDGDRMMECVDCGVWQHTGCNLVTDDRPVSPVLPVFVCDLCARSDWYIQDPLSEEGEGVEVGRVFYD